MKKLFIIASAAALACACNSQDEPVITSGDLTLNIDGNMHFKVESSAEGAKEYFADFCTADQIIADEATIDTWDLQEWKEEKNEDGKTYTIRGNWKEDGYDIEKILTEIVTLVKAPK